MSELTVEVQRREVTGKNALRRLRATGVLPAVVYGGGRDPLPIQVDRRTLIDLLGSGAGENSLFLLQLGDGSGKRHAMIREMQVDPVSRQLLHVDFQRVMLDEAIRVSVPIELNGVAEGVKNEGGLLDFVTRELEIECLPTEIPERLEVDVSPLHIGQHVEAGAVELPAGVTLVDEPNRVIASVTHARVAVEVVEEEAEELLIEAEREEPEVIGRGKEEAEEEGGEA